MKKIIVHGPALSQSGYGEQTRFALRALKEYSNLFDIYLTVTPWGKTSWIWEDSEERRWLDSLIAKTQQFLAQGGKFDMSLQVTIPSEWKGMAPVNVGYTAGIETTKIAKEWMQPSMSMNRIVVVSEHAKYGFENTVYPAKNEATGEMFEAKVNTPISVANYPVRDFEADPNFKLDLKHDFNFLVLAQWSPRKNIEKTIKGFVEEFLDQDVGLVIKINSANNSLHDREFTKVKLNAILQEYKDRKCSITYLHGDMTNEEMTALYQHPKIKAFINLAHGEGFGLPVFEAAYHGMPVIAPAWGGLCDFVYMPVKQKKTNKIKNTCMINNVNYDIKQIQKAAVWNGVLIKESQWCFPTDWHYKARLREVHKNYGAAASKAKKLKQYIRENFTKEQMYREFVEGVMGEEFLPVKDIEKVSFCIPTNGAKPEKTRLAISALKSQITTKKTEIVLAGDVSAFKDVEGVTFVRAKKKAHDGFLAGLRDLAAKKSTGDVLVFLDDDMILPPGWLWRLEEYSNSEGWDLLGNKLLSPDGSRFWDRALINPHLLVPYNHPSTDKRLYQTGGFFICRRDVYEKEGWDPTIPIYAEKENKPNEDVEYCMRLHEAGYIFKFDRENTTWHWDDNYTQVQLPDGNFQTLRKSIIEENFGKQDFPKVCEEFKTVLTTLGFEL